MEKDIRILFGCRVKELRLNAGLSQVKLAELADIDRTYLPAIELGKRNVSISIAQKLAKALNVDLCELFRYP